MATKAQAPGGLLPVYSLEEFFRDSLDAAMASNQFVMNAQTSHYVVNLLTLFSRSEEFYEAGPDGPQLPPLALMLAEASDAPTQEQRNQGLQRMGDVALFVAGFFADHLSRAAVDLDYYVCMGGGAYHSLAGSLRGTKRGKIFGDVFSELGAKFGDVVDVLNEVRDSARGTNNEDALRLYELWVKTGSARAARLLREMGVHPIGEGRGTYSH